MTGTDWSHALEALDHAQRRLDRADELFGPAARQLLEARARLLAQPLPEPTVSGDSLELLVFSRAGDSYAVEAASVTAVIPLPDPTPLPGAPPAVLGIVNHRGRVIPLIDLARLQSRSAEAGEARFAVVVAAAAASFALSADAVSGAAQVDQREVRPAADVGEQGPDAVVRAVTAAMVAILDVEALARDPRIEIHDEVE